MSSPHLRDQHAARGAEFMPFFGESIVRTYSDLAAERRALREGVALMDFSALGRVWLRGKDAQDYLHRQTSRNIRNLAIGQGAHAVHMTGDGKLAGEMILHRVREHDLLAFTMPACAERLAAAFDKFIFTEDCQVLREGDDRAVLSLLGPGATALVRNFLGWPPAEPPGFACLDGSYAGQPAVVAQTGIAGVGGYHLLVGAGQADALWSILVDLGALPVGWQVIDERRIEAGIPLWGLDHDESWIAMDAGLRCAIDFTKGCFPGQEVVAKMENIGHPRFALAGLVFESAAPAPPGSPLLRDGSEVGTVASGCNSPALGKAVALAHLKWGARDAGQFLTAGRNGEWGSVRVVELPFA